MQPGEEPSDSPKAAAECRAPPTNGAQALPDIKDPTAHYFSQPPANAPEESTAPAASMEPSHKAGLPSAQIMKPFSKYERTVLAKSNSESSFMPKLDRIMKGAITGYAGHVPAVTSENICGSSFVRTKEAAALVLERRVKGGSAALDRLAVKGTSLLPPDSERRRRSVGRLSTGVAGYTGHIPGLSEPGVLGGRFSVTRNVAQQLASERYLQQKASRQSVEKHMQLLGKGQPPPPFPPITQTAKGILGLQEGSGGAKPVAGRGRKASKTSGPRLGVVGYQGHYPRYMAEQRWLMQPLIGKPY
ncbi:unnamed protein product [Vitrella brassicaformis CCMP3155]|uniref:Uncharacterized protein n=1 Tax=Vitrella brassicaformis (strain CCMP3155) TaxID=1169540 RepID=A0A0G4H298_VITBC|nr:unnamed protein product [Vitrella brassicaformis CCMP3155]|mmetsp:Transcript_18592/g.44781  ORF Transcript_18592/g.44781 Transcript_18592/m.44781 type:complete len:302 (-) Transcript_18592:423-1328(-)|eukprot:CEM37771.1 unnamed protein product [Vitrella brassicaformis CCMP3155]